MWGMILLGAVKAGSQIYSGYKQKQAADQNAELMRQQAQFQREQANDQATTMKRQGEAFKGSQANAYAMSGVKTDRGTPLAILRETEKNINKDVARTRIAGQHAYETGLNQANALEQQGKDAFTSSLISGATSFAGTLANNIYIPKTEDLEVLNKVKDKGTDYVDYSLNNRTPVYNDKPPNYARRDDWQKKHRYVWE